MSKGALTYVILVLLLIGISIAALTFGSADIAIPDIISSLAGSKHLETEYTIITQIRMPRVLIAILVGGGLAAAGAVLQGLFRNPMADPGIIGVSSGGALGAVLAIFTGISELSMFSTPGLAFAGALLALFIVYRVSTHGGKTPMTTLLLCGIAVSALIGAVISFIISVALADYTIAAQIMYWLMGGIEAGTWTHLAMAGPVIIISTAATLFYSRHLDIISLGERNALSLGVDVQKTRAALIVLSSLITGASVAVSGIIGFVGLVVPHIMRQIAGPNHKSLIPSSFLAGSILLVLADIIARTAIAPVEIRLGIITSAIGAPFFIYLLIRNRKKVISDL